MRGIIQKRKIRCAYGICIQRVWTPDLDLKDTEFEEQHKYVAGDIGYPSNF